MRDLANTPTAALMRDIWQRNHAAFAWLGGIMLLVSSVNLLTPASARAAEVEPHATGLSLAFGFLNQTSILAVLLLVLAIFGYTESDRENSVEGFPRRLFTLPVTSLQLIVVPMLSGIAGIELVYGWAKLQFFPGERATLFVAVLFGSYMVVYQSFIWTVGSRLGPIRMIALGMIACCFFYASIEPSYSEKSLTFFFSGLAFAAFVNAWISIAHQRSGGGGAASIRYARDDESSAETFGLPRLPERTRAFASAQSAQCWFEWRRSGSVLPLLVGGLLFAIIGPESWHFRAQAGDSIRILIVCFFMPILLSAMVGKAFSKPDFWSEDLSLPVVVAAKPLATVDLIAIKVRVALGSAAASWLLVLMFVSVWLSFWANARVLAAIRLAFLRIGVQSVLSQFAIVGLLVVVGAFLTWRFLVVSLWLGLSGSSKVFTLTAIPYVLVPVVGLALFLGAPLYGGIESTLVRWGSTLEWIAVLAIILKLWAATSSLRQIGRQMLRRCLTYWVGATACFVFLAIALWQGIQRMGIPNLPDLKTLLILFALVIVPLGRLSLAPMTLAKNRHR